MKNVTLFFVILIKFSHLQAQLSDTVADLSLKLKDRNVQEFKVSDHLYFQYDKPKLFDFIVKIPHDFGLMGAMFIQKDNLILFGASVGATAALVPYDQKIVIDSRNFGKAIGFQSDHSYSGPIKMFPNNINSAIYRLGNGFTALMVGGGLLIYGISNDNYRAIHTSSELLEGLIISGILVQPLKRITGRESPYVAAENSHGGNWQLFPSFSAYQKNTPKYDAMPSGHITTLMTTVIILSENYKEIKWIKPVGFGLMGLMSYEMLQSKVHWASDYPIAVFMGYLIGKNIVKSRITERRITDLGHKKGFVPKFQYSFNSSQNYTLIGVNIIF